MFFGTGNPNLRSILKPEVELMVFLRMRSDKITKNAENVLKIQFKGLISRMFMFFGAGNPKLRSIFKPEVELMVFLRMRSYKITKNAEKVLKIQFRGLIFRMYMFFGAGNPNMRFILKPEVELICMKSAGKMLVLMASLTPALIIYLLTDNNTAS